MLHFQHLKKITELNNTLQSPQLEELLKKQLFELAEKEDILAEHIKSYITLEVDYKTAYVKKFLARYNIQLPEVYPPAKLAEYLPNKLCNLGNEPNKDLIVVFQDDDGKETSFGFLSHDMSHSYYLSSLAKRFGCVVIKLSVTEHILSVLELLLDNVDYRNKLKTLDEVYQFIRLVEELELTFTC